MSDERIGAMIDMQELARRASSPIVALPSPASSAARNGRKDVDGFEIESGRPEKKSQPCCSR
jgi:hypothetical protein